MFSRTILFIFIFLFCGLVCELQVETAKFAFRPMHNLDPTQNALLRNVNTEFSAFTYINFFIENSVANILIYIHNRSICNGFEVTNRNTKTC